MSDKGAGNKQKPTLLLHITSLALEVRPKGPTAN